MSSRSEFVVTITGHTDQDGSEEYNLVLSSRRAQSVSNYLINQGIPKDLITVNHLGETALVDQSDTEDAKQKNRRVEVVAQYYEYSSIENLVDQISSNTTVSHRMESEGETNIRLEQGTNVIIPQGAFVHQDGSPVSGEVSIECVEAFSYLDMLDHNLSTRTADEVLETGGMISVMAYSNGEELKVADGKEITIVYPPSDTRDDMNLFTSVEADGQIIWEDTGEEVEVEDVLGPEYTIKIDLSNLLAFEFEELEKPQIEFGNMVEAPGKMRKPYPPSERLYSKDDYALAYQKYEDKLETYISHLAAYPDVLKTWQDESYTRNNMIREYRKAQVRYGMQKRLQIALSKVSKGQHSKCHEKLINEVFAFVFTEQDPVVFNNRELFLAAYQNQTRAVMDNLGFSKLQSVSSSFRKLFPQFLALIDESVRRIRERKIEMSIIDSDLTNYVISTGTTGWLNVDRFVDVGGERVNINVSRKHEKENDDVTHLLVFHDLKILNRAYTTKEEHKFKSVPTGLKAKIISIKVKNRKAYLAEQDIITGDAIEHNPMYRKAQLTDIRLAIARMERV